jgi:hypothetical protein
MSTTRKHKRRIKLIKPRLQLHLIAAFIGLSALGFLLQALLIAMRLSERAAFLPTNAGNALIEMIPRLPLEVLLLSFGILLPLTFAVGVLVTFRIAGPVFRFEQFLKEVINGTQIGPCRIRRGDALHELCDLINEATEPLRQSRTGPQSLEGESEQQHGAP